MDKLSNFMKYVSLVAILLLCGCSCIELSLSKEELKVVAMHTGRDEVYPVKEWLHNSIRNLGFDIARKLVLQGADVNSEDAEGQTPLFYFGLTQRDPDDYSVDFKSMGEFLINHGADINHRDFKGNTPLHATVENSRISELLVSEGADVNAKNNEGITPLHIAAYDFRFDRYDRPTKNIKILLNAKADVDIRDNDGLTPLHYAVKSDNYKTCELLIKNGADVNISDNQGNTALDMARKEYRFVLMCLLSDTRESAKKLAFSDFFRAINHDDVSYIKYINKRTIDMFIKEYTISPLILAVMMNRIKVVKFLISRGADINVKCNLPKDYLYLGENWAEIEYYAYNKWTPLQIAKNKEHTDIIKLLSNK